MFFIIAFLVLMLIILFLIFQRNSKKYRNHIIEAKTDWLKTNSDALIGQKGIVTSVIMPHNNGYVKISGEVWLAKSKDDQTIQAGHIVEVVSVSGCHVVVKAKHNNNNHFNFRKG